jgi:hypothetical protein
VSAGSSHSPPNQPDEPCRTAGAARRLSRRPFVTVAFQQQRMKTSARWNSNVETYNRWAVPLKGSRISLNAAGIDDLGSVPKSSWMVKAFLSAALVFVVSAYPALAQDTKVSVGMMGIGGMSCAHWRATKEHLSEGTVWIYGFWTGLNYVAAASEQPQSGTDTAEIVAEVKKTCAQAPSQSLAGAVWTTYLEFQKR